MIKNTNAIKTNFIKPVINSQPKRSMIRSKLCWVMPTRLSISVFNEQPKRFYPNKLGAYKYKEKFDESGSTMEINDTRHIHAFEKETNLSLGFFTSEKYGPDGTLNQPLDPVKMNGNFTPILDPKTKEPLLDAAGQMAPDNSKINQFFARKPPKIVNLNSSNVKILHNHQPFLDKHEDTIIQGKNLPNPPIEKQ